MPHFLIFEAVKKWPEHWQKCFEELRISMGCEGAYRKICAMRKVNPYA